MGTTVEVLVETDEENKIFYTEDQFFPGYETEEIMNAKKEIESIKAKAITLGYTVIKKEKHRNR